MYFKATLLVACLFYILHAHSTAPQRISPAVYRKTQIDVYVTQASKGTTNLVGPIVNQVTTLNLFRRLSTRADACQSAFVGVARVGDSLLAAGLDLEVDADRQVAMRPQSIITSRNGTSALLHYACRADGSRPEKLHSGWNWALGKCYRHRVLSFNVFTNAMYITSSRYCQVSGSFISPSSIISLEA